MASCRECSAPGNVWRSMETSLTKVRRHDARRSFADSVERLLPAHCDRHAADGTESYGQLLVTAAWVQARSRVCSGARDKELHLNYTKKVRQGETGAYHPHFSPRIDMMYPMTSRKSVGVSNENWGMSRWGNNMVSAKRSDD